MPAYVIEISSKELRELLEKYDLLLSLRDGEPGRTITRRDAFRAVAERFPGALREWDKLSASELTRRRECVVALLTSAATAPLSAADLPSWLRYSVELHAGLRAILLERRELPSERGRRLSERAYAEIAARHGVSVEAVKQAIFAGVSDSEES